MVSNKTFTWFVCRAPNGGPFSKRVRRLQAPSILTWFQWRIDEARTATAPTDVAAAELGGAVDELAALFQAVQAHALRTPRSMTALRTMLREHAWGEVDPEASKRRVLADRTTLRVLPEDGSSVVLFFEQGEVTEHPDRLSFLLHEESQLPSGDSPEPYPTPFAMPVVVVDSIDSAAVYVCELTPRQQVPGHVTKLAGVDLPRLPAWLRGDVPPDLQRLAQNLVSGDASDPPWRETDHRAVVGAHVSTGASHPRWILFDDRWAAAHRELATSLLRYVLSWDPWAELKTPSAPRTQASQRTPAPKKRRPTQVELRQSATQEASWRAGLAGRTGADAQPYSPRAWFEEKALIDHPSFGLGFVAEVTQTKCQVVFEHSTRWLVHGMS